MCTGNVHTAGCIHTSGIGGEGASVENEEQKAFGSSMTVFMTLANPCLSVCLLTPIRILIRRIHEREMCLALFLCLRSLHVALLALPQQYTTNPDLKMATIKTRCFLIEKKKLECPVVSQTTVGR